MSITDRTSTLSYQASRDQVSRCPEALNKETRQLMKHFFGDSTGHLISNSGESEALSTMKRISCDVLAKYGNKFRGMNEKLSIDHGGDKVRSVNGVARAIFEDGTTNWGRIVSLVTFGLVMCRDHKKDKGRFEFVESVGEQISTYLLTEQKDWLLKNNSWVGFVEFFAEPRHTSRGVIIFFIGFTGTLIMLNTFKSFFV